MTYSVPGCIVAENKNLQILWLFLQWLKIESIYSKNPNSNILSASSITRNSRFSKGNYSASLWSFKGVEINISQQLTKSLYYSSVLGVNAFLKIFTRADPFYSPFASSSVLSLFPSNFDFLFELT